MTSGMHRRPFEGRHLVYIGALQRVSSHGAINILRLSVLRLPDLASVPF